MTIHTMNPGFKRPSATDHPDPIGLLDGRVQIVRSPKGLAPTTDTVLLAASCPARPGDTVVDMGCGTGAAGLCVLFRVPGTRLEGVEIQADLIPLARQSAGLNGLQDRAAFIRADIRSFRPEKTSRYDHALCNPPYLEEGCHTPPPHDEKAKAVGGQTTVQDWVDACFHSLKPRGSLTLVHRADAADKVLQALGKRFGAVEIIPIWPGEGKAATRLVLRARKDRRSPAILHPGLVLHEQGRRYTAQAEKILREGLPLYPLAGA